MKDQILLKLKEEGWNIKEEFFESIFEKPGNFQSTLNFLANSDFKDCGAPSLPNDVGKNKNNLIKTPLVLQVTNVRNVSAPKANEGSATAPRMLRLTLTDGIHYVHGLEISFIKSLSLKTPPGTKIKLYSKIPVIDRYLLLSPSNTELIGGVVEELYQKWKLSESVSKYSRSGVLTCDGTGPPPWVPFGKKIMVEKEKDFKAMEDSASKKKENDDFEHQRQQVVMELTKESSQKVFGGGKQMLDSNVQKIINSGGFTINEAEWALKRNKNDLKKALQDLRRNQSYNPEDTRGTSGYEERERGRGRGGKRGRGRGKVKDNKGPDGSDDELPHSAVFRPSGPASLLDYLESRISEKAGGGEDEPKYKTEKYDDNRYYPRGGRDSRGSRGRGRGGGGGGYINKQVGNKVPKSEPTFSVENWPSLGQEKAVEERKNDVHSETSSHREAGVRNSSHENKFEVQSSYPKKKPEVVSQPVHTNNGNKNYQYQDSFNNQSYLGSNNSSINFNRSETPQSHQHQNFRGDTRQQFHSSDSYTYEDTRKEPPQRRRNDQPYFKRGMGRDPHRGSSGSMHSGNQMYGNNASNQSYYNQEETHYRTDHVDGYCSNTQRVHTAKEKELIAQFERSMVMAGHYDPNYMHQNSGGYSQGYQQHQNYYDNYSYSNRGFAGTYEFHRGGDGYPRRSRGRRGGRY